MLAIKEGAEVNGLKVEMLLAFGVAESVYDKQDIECVLTEGTGGKHGRGSLHYVGLAIDIRTRDFLRQQDKVEVAKEIGDRLGSQYDVALEKTHIHIEFQPK